MWFGTATPAQAASYPPQLGCFVTGSLLPQTGMLQVQGAGFGTGQLVRIGVDGRYQSQAITDASGSFAASMALDTAGATVTAADLHCRSASSIANRKAHGSTARSRPDSPEPVAPVAASIPYVKITGLAPQLFLGVVGGLLLAGTALTGLTGRLGRR